MSQEWEARKRGRDDLVRVIADHERKSGRLPDMRKVEREAERVAERNDRKKDNEK
jgi:hypothetical protein